MLSAEERRVLEAARACCERWGIAKVSIDDVAAQAGVSRATLYRMFPGGKDVLFEGLRVMELEEFFTGLRSRLEGADNLRDLLIQIVVHATRELRADEHLALMMASEPGEVLGQLTVEGVPRILRFANAFIAPLLADHLDRAQASRLVDLVARLVISYFLAPSEYVDLGDFEQAGAFVDGVVLTAFNLTTPHP